jgi:NADH-quinone oxidoreductase subunit A
MIMDLNSLLLSPPIAFLMLFVFAAMFYLLLRALVIKGKDSSGKRKPYACGEDIVGHRLQPDYSQFFPLAFFFTIMHVVAMIIATVPAGSISASIFAVVFTLSAAVGLMALFRKES